MHLDQLTAKIKTLPSKPFYDDYEVHGCADYTKQGEKVPKGAFSGGRQAGAYTEQVSDAEATFFSLYGHLTDGGLECIGDFDTRQAAEEAKQAITMQIKHAAFMLAAMAETFNAASGGFFLLPEHMANFINKWI